MNKFKILNKGR